MASFAEVAGRRSIAIGRAPLLLVAQGVLTRVQEYSHGAQSDNLTLLVARAR